MPKIYKYFIGLGGNIGSVEQTFIAAVAKLKERIGSLIAVSSLYKSEALQLDSTLKQDDYLNCVVVFESSKSELEVLNEISKIEFELGRRRIEKWGARNIDIDIIAKDQLVFNAENLQIPHPEMQNRSFVLMPLIEIAPDWEHPSFKKTAQQMLNDLKNQSNCKILKPFPHCEF